MLLLAFDTATDVATSALLHDGRVLGERVGVARSLLEDVQALLESAGRTPGEIDRLVVGTGPGSFTSTRIGLAVARGLALALDAPGAGVSTLAALGSQEAFPIVDARRGEVFVEGPRAVAPEELELTAGTLCLGSGAVRYRATFERLGAIVPPDDDERHVPRASLHAALARDFGPVEAIEPLYVRVPDAEASLA